MIPFFSEEDGMSRMWDKKASRYLAHFRIFDLREDIYINPRTASEYPAFILETRDWINVIPITSDNQVVMVRQYRFAAEEVTLEIPGGLVDLSDKTMQEAARRELLEETGYDSNEILSLGVVRPNPAILNNRCHVFWAKNVEWRLEQELDDGEDISIELIPLDQIPSLIHNGSINHSIVLNAFHLLDVYLKTNNGNHFFK